MSYNILKDGMLMVELEKRDMLIEQLVMLYQIKAASKEDNPVLDYNIVVTEQRLTALGYCDLNKLKP